MARSILLIMADLPVPVGPTKSKGTPWSTNVCDTATGSGGKEIRRLGRLQKGEATAGGLHLNKKLLSRRIDGWDDDCRWRCMCWDILPNNQVGPVIPLSKLKQKVVNLTSLGENG